MSEVKQESMAYIGHKPCGCLTFAVVDVPRMAKEAAKETAKAIRNGEIVSRVTCEAVRTMAWSCPTHKKQRDAKKQSCKSHIGESIQPFATKEQMVMFEAQK